MSIVQDNIDTVHAIVEEIWTRHGWLTKPSKEQTKVVIEALYLYNKAVENLDEECVVC